MTRWLAWAQQLHAIAHNGLLYSESAYDRERYQQLNDLATEIFSTHTGLPPTAVPPLTQLQPGYATPKVDVRAACFRDGKILLVQEKSDGRWCLPGGWADVGDTPVQAVTREVHEEAGFTCVPRKLIAVYDGNRHGAPLVAFHAYKLFFWCELTGGDKHPAHDILDVNFFARDALPELSTPRSSLAQIYECFAHFNDPTLLTVFD